MASVILENFRYGLDTRRSTLTSVLGVLTTLKNAHINQGGEIEKRKTFQGITLTPTPASGVLAILGVEALKDSIVIFGAETNADTANWPPAGFTYQALTRNPAANAAAAVCNVAGTPNYCASCENWTTAVKATGVIYSTVYSNKAFVICTMADGTLGAFYNGVEVNDVNLAGTILPGMDSNLKLFCSIVKWVNTSTDFTADLIADGTGLKISGPKGRQFLVGITGTGSLCGGMGPTTEFASSPTSEYPGTIASGSFEIVDGVQGAGNQITSVKVGNSELLAGAPNPILFTTDAEITAALVVASINAGASSYNARNRLGVVTLMADAAGTTDNGKVVTVTVTGKVLLGRCEVTLNGTAFTITWIRADGVDLLSAPQTFASPTTLTAFLTTVQDNINAGTGTHGYIAIARGSTLKVGKKVTASSDGGEEGRIPVVVRITTASGGTGYADPGVVPTLHVRVDIVPESGGRPIFLPVSSGSVLGAYTLINGGYSSPFRSTVTGGSPPYKYEWKLTRADGITPLPRDLMYLEGADQDVARIKFTEAVTTLTNNQSLWIGTLVLKVTDWEGTVATFSARLTEYNNFIGG